MVRILFVQITLAFYLLINPCAVQGQYFFKKLTEENGLSDNRVTCFLKDRTGFLWIGTRNGLNRYDGHSFKIFKPAPGNSISNEVINDIVQDSSGKIWVATMAGLNIYDPVTNLWETIMPNGNDPPNGLPSFIVWDLAIDEHNKIWIVCDVWQFSVYDPITKKFSYFNWASFSRQKKFETFPRYRSIQKITRKSGHEWWLGTTIGLFSLNIRSGEFQFHGGDYGDNLMDIKYVVGANTNNGGGAGNVFSITEDGQLFCYNEIKKLYTKLPVIQQTYPVSQWNYPDNHRNNFSKDKLLMPHPSGMLEINTATGEAILFTHSPALSSSLLPGETRSIYTDNTGIIWVGSGNGINYYNSHNSIADFIPLTTASDKDNADRMSAALYDAVDSKYYVTSVQSKEAFVIDEQTGLITSIRSIGGKPLSACTNICTDRQNNIWLLTETNVYKYDRDKKQFSLFPTPNNNENVIFQDFIEDKKGNYWLATWHDGIYLYKTKEKTFRRITDEDDMFTRNITCLINDPVDSAVWIGTFGVGAYRYDLRLDTAIIYTETESNPDYRQLTLVRDIEADASGKLWLTTVGAGLYVYRHGYPPDRSFNHITSKKGLTHSSYYSIAIDDRNRLWLLSGKGLSVIDTTGKLLYEANNHPVLGFANYAPAMTYPKRIFYNKIKNELLVPVAGGLMLYYLDREIPSVSFPVVFTDISVDDRSILYEPEYASKKNIIIPYQSNSLSFQFAALNYDTKGNIQYEYKLHENDAEWKPAGISGTLNFPDLSSGRYTLMVRAKDTNGNTSGIASLSFFIKPPFWKTAWFMAAVVVVLSAILFFWIRSLQRKLKAEKILNYFATSLYGQNTVDDVFWDVAKNCISQLRLEDCVIYLYEPAKRTLIQKAAYGPKNPEKHEIINTLEIPYGKGIVGTAAATEKPVIVKDTRKDARYIVDDQSRRSEIAVPIFVEGKLFGVIDSEHSRKNFYSRWHLRLLQKIAGICSNKISKYLVAEKVRTDIARDLHDEMGSTLTSINIMSTLALQQMRADTVNNNLQKIKDYSGDMMESMSDIVWAINPMNDSMDRMILRMRELAEELLEPARINYTFHEEGAVKTLKLDVTQRKELYLVFKEAVNNAVKYSGASELLILLREQHGSLHLEVKDNGAGFDISKNYSGSGIQNMRSRAGKINADLQISSARGQGTMVSVSVPLA
jgi:signal transduction histidine kinase/ligand-binding sensor domain-containing protein